MSDKKKFKDLTVIDYVILAVLIVLILIISGFITKLLWNAFLAGAGKGVGVFTFIKPLDSIVHAILVMLAIDIVFSRRCENICYSQIKL